MRLGWMKQLLPSSGRLLERKPIMRTIPRIDDNRDQADTYHVVMDTNVKV